MLVHTLGLPFGLITSHDGDAEAASTLSALSTLIIVDSWSVISAH